MSTLLTWLVKFIRIPWQEKLLFFEAYLRLGLARFGVLTVPFARLASSWGVPMYETFRVPLSDRSLPLRVSRAILRARRYTPWKSNCLPQAMTAKSMLQKRGLRSTLYLGLMLEASGEVTAHAWLRCGDVYVTGGRGARFTVVGTFAESDELAASSTWPAVANQAFSHLKDE